MFAKIQVVLTVLFLLFVILQIPWVQSFFARQLTPILSEKLGFEVSISGVSIQWFDEAQLYTVNVKDREGVDMIDADVLKVDFSIFSLLKGGDIFLDQVVVSNTAVNLVQRDTLNFTEFVRAINRLAKPADTTSTKRKPNFYIENAILDNVVFSYHRPDADTLGGQVFEYNHFKLEYISAVLDNFRIAKDTVEFNLRNLQGIDEHSGLTIKKLKTDFRYSNEAMVFKKLDAKINDTHIKDSLAFRYKSPADFSEFNQKIRMYANLNQSVIHTKDLALFAPSLQTIQDVFTVSGKLKGTVDNLLVKNLDAEFGKGSKLKGKVTFLGLPVIDQTLMNLDFTQSEVKKGDLEQYIPKYTNLLNLFGNTKLDANFYGFTSDFVSKGEFKSELGYVKTDINLKTNQAFYDGKIILKDFNIGKLTGQEEYVQKISMDGKIKGTGFSVEKADFDLDAKISRLGALNYDYQGIATKGHFQRKLFDGEVVIRDPNLQLVVEGEINFADSSFNFVAKLDTVSFLPTNLLDKPGYARFLMEANFEGLDPSKITGEIALFDTELLYDNTDLQLEYFDLISDKSAITQDRILLVYSELFDLQAEGQFEYRQVLKDVKRFVDEYQLSVSGNDSLKQIYYSSEAYAISKKTDPYDLDFQLDTKEVNRLLRLFNKSIYVSPNAKAKGNLSVGDETSFIFTASADTILYGKHETYLDTVLLTLSKSIDSVFFSTELIVSSEEQNWGGTQTKDLLLYGISRDSTFFFNNEIKHLKSGDEIDVEGSLAFTDHDFLVDLKQTNFQFLQEDWKSSGRSFITIARDLERIHFDNFQFSNQKQRVRVDGNISKDTADVLEFLVKDLDMHIFEPYVGKPISGRINVDGKISNALDDMRLETNVQIDSVYMSGYEVGSIKGNSTWLSAVRELDIKAALSRRGFEVLKLDGEYMPDEPNPKKKLNLRAILDGVSLQILEPFLEDQISEIDGTAIGILKIKGSPTELSVKGDAFIYKGKFKLNYLNSMFYFSDRIRFRDGFIGMKNMRLQDVNGNKAILNGGIYHVGFKNFVFQLDGKMDNFMVLNTKPSEDAMYYGTAISSGTFSLFGPPENVEISVTAKTEKGTKIYIPLDGYASVEDASFIKFVSPDSGVVEVEEKLNISGIKMDFNIELTPDAYCEIIFDKKAGDIIRGNGQGKLKMLIDLQGDFNMFGDVEILQGAYNFTLLNVVNKEFGVRSGSRISWTGDPYSADLDITATYTQKASLYPILEVIGDSSILNSPEVRRGYPVEVLLNLKGELLSPDITFGVDVRDYPSSILVAGFPISLESYVAAFEERMKRDEQELSRQVFSLIVLKKLSPENTFSGITQSAGSSVSELLTNQLSYWVSQVDENLEIDFDINGISADALNTFQLRLAYTFLDGRLRVSREGGFTNTQNEADPSSLIGDWTVEYLLTPDGKLRMKMYRKQNINSFSSGIENNSTAGVSLLRTKSFDSLKDLIPKFLKKKKDDVNKKEDKDEEEEDGGE